MPMLPDKSSDPSLLDLLQNYLGQQLFAIHRIDRPASGVALFARSKAHAAHYSSLFRSSSSITKEYLAVTEKGLETDEGLLEDSLIRNPKLNKSFVTQNISKGKRALMAYSFIVATDRYWVYHIRLLTGRHHQIRTQLSARDCPIKGDVKYGARRKNKDRSIHLHAWKLRLSRPDYSELLVEAPIPPGPIWGMIDTLV